MSRVCLVCSRELPAAAGSVLRHAREEQAHHCAVNGPQRPLQMQEVRVGLCDAVALVIL